MGKEKSLFQEKINNLYDALNIQINDEEETIDNVIKEYWETMEKMEQIKETTASVYLCR